MREKAALGEVVVHAEDIRRGGSAALDLAYTAVGRVDGYFEAGVKPWDIAAGVLLVREAGGEAAAQEVAPTGVGRRAGAGPGASAGPGAGGRGAA